MSLSNLIWWLISGGVFMSPCKMTAGSGVSAQFSNVRPTCEVLEPRQLFAASPRVHPVLEWNDIAIETLRMGRSRIGPTQASRSMAIVHIAAYDALEAIKRNFEPILVKARGARSAN